MALIASKIAAWTNARLRDWMTAPTPAARLALRAVWFQSVATSAWVGWNASTKLHMKNSHTFIALFLRIFPLLSIVDFIIGPPPLRPNAGLQARGAAGATQ